MTVASVDDALAAHGDRYLGRMFTAEELAECNGSSGALAACVAGKEAVFKVIEPGPEDPVVWREIEIRSGARGREVLLRGHAAAMARRAGLRTIEISLACRSGSTVGAIAQGFP